MNKLSNVEVVLGDVAEKSKDFENQFDRVLMPLPEKSVNYMRDAMRCLKKGGMCHFYFFENRARTVKQLLLPLIDVKYYAFEYPFGI